MDNLIINGIFTLSGTVIGALFSFFAARDSKGMARKEERINDLEKKTSEQESIIKELNRDINFFYNEEELLLEKIAEKEGKSALTLKKDCRAEIAQEVGYPLSTKSQPSNVKRHM